MWIGLHDHADQAVRWIDPRVSYTWLRAFESCIDVTPSAYLREHNYDYNVEDPIRHVLYRFRTSDISEWVNDIVLEDPSLILYNCCYYEKGAAAVEQLRDQLVDAVHVIRIHHHVDYLAAQPGFREFLLACDVAIAPTRRQIEAVRKLGFFGPVYALPFGIDAASMRQAGRSFKERDIQLASASNPHPARNLDLVHEVYEKLRARGRRVENYTGLTSSQLANKLGRTKVFWQTSMTEASGSRILPEAIAAGCIPVVFQECETTHDLLQDLRTGISIQSGIVYDYLRKTTEYPDDIVEVLTSRLDAIIDHAEALEAYDGPALGLEYEKKQEVEQLTSILANAGLQWRKPRSRWRRQLSLPADADGYAFNPTLLRTVAGLICIYRHVGENGVRTLRRCILNDDLAADNYSVWSDEVSALGGNVEWYADPRAFQAGPDYFVSFNTGHSEAPNHIYLVKIDANGAPLNGPQRLQGPSERRTFEKNWGMFYSQGNIFVIYSVAPFVVMRLEFRDEGVFVLPVTTHEWHSESIEALSGEIHGGAAPIVVDGHGYYVTQSTMETSIGRVYTGSILKFEADPPFQPLAVAPLPLFMLSVAEMRMTPRTPLNPDVTQCFYPCGALYESDDMSLTISYGVNDFRSGCRNYKMDDIEKCLSSVKLVNSKVEPRSPRRRFGLQGLQKLIFSRS